MFKHKLGILWGALLVTAVLLVACTGTPTDRSNDPAIAAIYADADAKAAQKRADQLKSAATQAANATATAAFAPFAVQTQEAQSTAKAQLALTVAAAPLATATMVAAQTATAAPMATEAAAMAQTATAVPLATDQALQVIAAQTASAAPTATWVAFKLEEAKRNSELTSQQQDTAINRIIDLAWIGALILFVVGGGVILGRQISRNLSQTATTRASAATQVEQARADAERERQKAEDAKARAAQARPPVYVIEEKSDSMRPQPTTVLASQPVAAGHGDTDIQMIWESPSDTANGSLEQTGSMVIDNQPQIAQ